METSPEELAAVEPEGEARPSRRRHLAARLFFTVFFGTYIALGLALPVLIVYDFTHFSDPDQCSAASANPRICLYAQIVGRTLSVTGTTGLPHGAILKVWADDYGPIIDKIKDWQTETVSLTVKDGKFAREFDLSNGLPDELYVSALFELGPDQPASVIDLYGADGGQLEGPNVFSDDFGPAPRAVQVYVYLELLQASPQ